MKIVKIAQSQEDVALKTLYDIALQKPEEQRKPYEKMIIQHVESSQQSGSPFYAGQKLTFTKKSGYRGWCTVEKVNEDGSLSIIDHSGRRMSKFKPVQMGMNMFEEM